MTSHEREGGWRIHHVHETGSTNADLAAAAIDGAPDRTVLVADHQTAGRGRLDRRWEAPAGANLLASVLLRDVPELPATLIQRVGLAIIDGVRRSVARRTEPAPRRAAPGAHSAESVRLKWPNDVVIDDAKLAGVLAQFVPTPNGNVVVVGFGVNIGWAPRGAACVHDLVAPSDVASAPTPIRVLEHVLDAFDATPAGPDGVRDRYRNELATLGRTVRVLLPGGEEFDGVARDVDGDGRLVVTGDGIERTFDVGDIVHLRPR